MEIKTFESEITILESHLDTFGHVNNATYLTLYEQARWEMITEGDWGLDRIMKEKVGPVITNINIAFKREITLREKIKIVSKVAGFVNPKIMTIEQKMIGTDGVIKNEMTMHAGLFDLKQRKLLPPSDEWMQAIGVTGDWREEFEIK